MDKVQVIFRKQGFMVINKPAGLISQGPGTQGKELWEMVQERYPEGNVAHRIDKQTSGAIIAGMNYRAVLYLKRNWHQITKKVYLAIISEPEWDTTTVDTLIEGKTAVTQFTILQRVGGLALVQCELIQNGRKHQIRRHLSSIGYPLMGDYLYKGGPSTPYRRGQMLHAWRFSFSLPDKNWRPSDEWQQIEAPIPADFRQYGFNFEAIANNPNQAIETWEE